MPVYPGAPTSRPAPVPRTGTLPLAVSAARGPPFRSQQVTFTLIPWPSLSGRQVLLFHASARDELTPPLHRAPPGQHAGRPLAEGPLPQAFVPGTMRLPGFDAIVPPIDASAVVHTRSSSRRPPDPLTAGLFRNAHHPGSLPAQLAVVWAPRLHGEPGGPTSITGTARFMPATFYIASLPFQDTPQIGGSRATAVTSNRHAARLVFQRVSKPADSGAPRHRPRVFDVQPDDLSTAGSCAIALARRLGPTVSVASRHRPRRHAAWTSRSTCRGPADRGTAQPVSGRWRARGRRAAGRRQPRSRTR